MRKLASLVHRRRRRVLLAAALLFVVGAVVGGPLAGLLKVGETDFQDPSSEGIRATHLIEDATDREAGFGLVAIVPARAAERVRRGIARIPGVQEVRGPTGGTAAALMSRDGRLKVLLARVPHDAGDVADVVRARYGREGVRVGGSAVTFDELGTKVSDDLARAELLAFPLLFLLSLWVFRSAVAALLPLLIGGLSIVTTFLVLRLVNAEVTGLSIFAVNLVTGIGLGLAIDYSLFIVSRFREELAAGAGSEEALRRTLNSAGRTVLYSSLTIAAATASLLVFPLRFLYSMAIGGTVVALVAAGIALTVLPASLAVLGDRVNGGSLARWRRASARDARPAHEGPWYRIARGVMRRPALVAVATATFLVLVGLPFLRVNFVSADQRMLPAAAEAREVADFVERDVPGAAADPIRVVATARPDQAPDVAAYRDAVARVPHVGQVAPPRRLDATRWLIEAVPRGDAQDEQNLDAVRAVRRLPAAFPIAVGGSGAAFLDQQRALGDHLPMAIALLAITTFTILFLMTGSVVLPLKALLMNALSLSAAFGLLVLVFQDGRLEGLLDFRSAGGLEATQPVLLFAIAFGLATDYGVFLLSRIKEARDAGMGDRDAVAFGVERTGRIITAAALLFCVAVGAFATSGVLFIKQLGVGTAMAVAIDATIIRALLVPALMTLLGRWNWWAPRPLKRLHARVGLVDA